MIVSFCSMLQAHAVYLTKYNFCGGIRYGIVLRHIQLWVGYHHRSIHAHHCDSGVANNHF